MSRARSSKSAKSAVQVIEVGVPIEQCLLVQDEIWRIVSNAAHSNSRISLGKQARKIASSFPATGFSLQSITDALVFAAVDCGVAFEVATPAPRQAIPGFLALVGKKRKVESEAKLRPTFAGVQIPAAT
jgi:hypothetical protein